ncbi:Uncharacterized mitochondrial protein AtMg00310, partial [Linum grandiflorum]
ELGFWDFHGLNIALLAKQLWSLHQRSDTLIGRIMKAKYYKNSSVIESVVGYNPSFIWHSLMGAHELIWLGIRWRVGNGDSVRI